MPIMDSFKKERKTVVEGTNVPPCVDLSSGRIIKKKNLPMKRFVGHTEVEEDGLEICLYFSDMGAKTRERFVEALNDSQYT